MTVVILSQRETISLALHQNRMLHEEIGHLSTQVAELTRENARLSEAHRDGEARQPLERREFLELLRLRDEVGRLRVHVREAMQRQAAETGLPGAEATFKAAQAELLKAQAGAERATVVGVELRNAVVEFTRVADLYSKSLIGQAEYHAAAARLELVRSSLPRDPLLAEQVGRK